MRQSAPVRTSAVACSGKSCARADSATIAFRHVPHKRLWRLTGADGSDITCELEPIAAKRVLLVVRRNGETVLSETFAEKRDALARSVGVYKDMKSRSA